MTEAIDLTRNTRDRPPVGIIDAVAGRRVLIFGINYAPEQTGIAPYTTAVAEQLALTAASVTVIAGLPSYPAWKVEDGYAGWRRTERLNGVDLVRLWHFVPGNQTAALRGAYESTFLAHATAVGRGKRADLVIAVTPALGGAVAAAIVAKRLGVPLLIIVQDLMGKAAAQSGIAGGAGKVAAATGALEGWALRRAERVVIVSEAFRSAVRDYGVPANRIDLLPNWSHIATAPCESRELVRRRLGWTSNVRIALHTGNMGLKQDLGNIIDAARLAKDRTDLRFVLMGDGSQRSALQAQAAGLRNIEFLPPCRAADYAGILAAADVLVINERPSVGDMSLPSKLTSYFMSSRPIAAAVSPDGATAAELASSGAAYAAPAGKPEELLAAIDLIIADPDAAAQMGVRGYAHAMLNLTPEVAFHRLNTILKRLVGVVDLRTTIPAPSRTVDLEAILLPTVDLTEAVPAVVELAD